MIKSWIYVYKGIILQDYLESIPEDSWIMNLEKSNWGMLVCGDNGGVWEQVVFVNHVLISLTGGEKLFLFIYYRIIWAEVLVKSSLTQLLSS